MRLRLRDTSALAVGSVVSGLLAYVFFATTTRVLDPADASPVSVLWTYWSFSAAAITFPIQHWIARTVTAHRNEAEVRSALPRVFGIVAATALALGVLSWLARNGLFHRDGLAFPALVAGVTLGSAVTGMARGTLTARRRFANLAVIFVAENAVRCLGAAGLAVAGVRQPVAYGAALLIGYAVVIGWPAALRLQSAARVSSRAPLRFLRGASSGQLLAQVVLTGGPVLLALGGGTPVEVTALFAGLALFRAPYVLALGLVSQLTGLFTTFVVQNRRSTLDAARRLIIGLTVATTILASAFGGTVGSASVQLVFGPAVHLGRLETGLLAAGSSLALGNLVLTVLVLALHRPSGVARAWLAAFAVAAGCFSLVAVSPLDRTCWTFVVAQTTAFVVLAVEEAFGRVRLSANSPHALPSTRTDG